MIQLLIIIFFMNIYIWDFITYMYHSLSLIFRQYKDLKDRSKCRKLTWEQKDWDKVVAETGALVTTMKSGIIVPITIN